MSKSKNKKEKSTPQDNVITKTEQHSFTLKFSEDQLKAKQIELQNKLFEKYNLEQEILEAKEKIKTVDRDLKNLHDEIKEGGEHMSWEDCEVKIYRDTNKKEFYYEGVLVDTLEAEEEDFQLEIEETEEEDND